MFGNLFLQAYEALRHNRRRSFLTMLGMAWGIATVVLLLAYGAGFERGLWAAFRSFGTNLVFIFPGRTSMQVGGTKAGSEVRLTMKDFEHIQAEVPLLKRSSPEVFKQCSVAYGTRSNTYGVSGVYANYPKMRRMEFAEGSAFSEADDYTHTRVAFIGADVKQKLFSGLNAIGESIRVDGISYQVVGVLKHVINNSDDNLNGHVYVSHSLSTETPERLRDPTRAGRIRLSVVERQTMQLLAEGVAAKEIAHIMNISIKTVAFHRGNIKKKLGLQTTPELTKYAIERGPIQ